LPYTTDDFHYDYPAELIAQRPLTDRTASRLLLLDRASGRVTHGAFSDFPTLIHSGDVIVVNVSRVIPARLHGRRENGREAEVLLVHPEPDGSWLAMVHPGGKLKVGRTIVFDDVATLEVVDVVGGGLRRVRLSGSLDWPELMDRFGSVPLPPYIHRPPNAHDRDRYQTVYAREEGSVAAPTAGLHFTSDVLQSIRDRGAQVVEIVLHIGPGTFKPVATSDPEQHVMHAEWFQISDEAAQAVAEARGRVWAVGTTVARVLETVAAQGKVTGTEGWTELFIYPPYQFRIVDAVLTNFHLPCSTLLMLVCAFGGYEHVMSAYRAAVAERYRLYSYGDAMAIT
jgi:S-adenosylmethionine:tRNA ribosyltransferase-isomerase